VQQGKDFMSLEGQLIDQKSLRAVTGKTADWNEIAKDCIAFAKATGGRLLLGSEGVQDAPSAGQQFRADLPDTVRGKLVARTINRAVLPDVATAANGGQYIELRIPRAMAMASTTDGRYFLRVADQSKPVTGDDERGQKLNKLVWDDHRQSPTELIEPHRLAARVLEHLQRYPESAISCIHGRVGGEIHPKQVKRALEDLIGRWAVRCEGDYRWRRYWAVS